MPLLLVIGAVLIAGGIFLFAHWFEFFLKALKVVTPLGIIGLGGLLTYFGWEELRDKKRAFMDFSSPAEASRYQAEALAYQEKLDNFRSQTDADAEAGDKEKDESQTSAQTPTQENSTQDNSTQESSTEKASSDEG
ncbi:MAG: hypothetical protein LBJ64_00045 [Deltaproteobacteria bacterium]|jgi:FtsZ-interacting cell division protein ZipA|nr:hypothetical protein [Deltaproteobacteria bacterium]